MTDPMKPVRFKRQPCNILILTGSIGSGHISVARAISEALHRVNGDKNHPRVEIVDFLTTLKNFVTTATKRIYLGTLRISPKIYEFLFKNTGEDKILLEILNMLSVPFAQHKFLELMREKRPSVLVSTYPVFDILIKKCWKRYCRERGRKLPFVSVITDSMAIHKSWTYGNPDFFIVPNEDSKISLTSFGIPEKRIKILGYPVSHRFFRCPSSLDFQKQWNLSPKRKTLLLILSTGLRWSKVKKIIRAIKESKHKKMQLIIICGTHERWKKKLEKISWPWPTHITGWTKEFHTLIHGSDVVLTKAGGATVMECVSSGKPMMIIGAIPGQEIGNAMLVQKYNLGAVLNNDLSDFDRALDYILTHEARIKKNLALQRKPKASENVARFLIALTGHSN